MALVLDKCLLKNLSQHSWLCTKHCIAGMVGEALVAKQAAAVGINQLAIEGDRSSANH